MVSYLQVMLRSCLEFIHQFSFMAWKILYRFKINLRNICCHLICYR